MLGGAVCEESHTTEDPIVQVDQRLLLLPCASDPQKWDDKGIAERGSSDYLLAATSFELEAAGWSRCGKALTGDLLIYTKSLEARAWLNAALASIEQPDFNAARSELKSAWQTDTAIFDATQFSPHLHDGVVADLKTIQGAMIQTEH
jgi:hypothetical protein